VIQVPGDHATIQSAIDAATPGDEILVAPGSYAETIDFKGKAIALRSNAGSELTVIDGSGLNQSVVRCGIGEGPDTVLQGFTIAGGSAVFGGGMRNEGSSPTVLDGIFKGNSATDWAAECTPISPIQASTGACSSRTSRSDGRRNARLRGHGRGDRRPGRDAAQTCSTTFGQNQSFTKGLVNNEKNDL
jgi:pectin methylesterase-like acyl-CoA thioesterase